MSENEIIISVVLTIIYMWSLNLANIILFYPCGYRLRQSMQEDKNNNDLFFGGTFYHLKYKKTKKKLTSDGKANRKPFFVVKMQVSYFLQQILGFVSYFLEQKTACILPFRTKIQHCILLFATFLWFCILLFATFLYICKNNY